MKLQFSLATLLVRMTVLAMVAALSVGLPMYKTTWLTARQSDELGGLLEMAYPITAWEIVHRFVLWGPPTLATTLGALWAIRRLKSRRHTEPAGG